MTRSELGRERGGPPDFRSYIRNWPGNKRSDLTHLLAQPEVFPALVEALSAPFRDRDITKVVTVEAGGAPLGGALAFHLCAGLVFIRKAGNIPWEVETVAGVDYSGREKRLEMTRDALAPTDRVLIADDWSETGGQLKLAVSLACRAGATVVGAACLHIARAARRDPELAGLVLHDAIQYPEREN
jgi:adenine phosphoribosyltransferase